LNTERNSNSIKSLSWLIGFGRYDKELEDYKIKYKIENYLDIPKRVMIKYSVLDAIVTHRLYENAINNLVPLQPRIYEAYKKYVIPVIPIFLKMEINGMYIDREYLEKYHNKLQKEIKEIEKDICNIFGKKIEVGSIEQLGKALKEFGLPNLGETKKGFYKTGDEILLQWKQQGYEIADKILRYRKLNKLDDSFVGSQGNQGIQSDNIFDTKIEDEKETGIVKFIMNDEKVHSTYMPAITSSWRSSCITGDTKILLSDNSTISIKNLVDNLSIKDFYIKSHTGKIRKVLKGWKKNIVSVYKLELENGECIKLTENHEVYTNNGWKQLKNININGDKILFYGDI
jgi:hypothetical protein